MTIVSLSLRGALFAVFLLSAIGKLGGQTRFELTSTVRAIVPWLTPVAGALAWLVLFTEFVTAATLAADWRGMIGFVLAGCLLAVFTAVLCLAIVRGQRVECHCFGADGSRIGISHIARNLLLISFAMAGAATAAAPTWQQGSAALAAAVGVVIGSCLTRWDDLTFLAIGIGQG